MGWGRFLLLGDYGQQMDLQEQREEIARLKRSLRSQPLESIEAELRRLQAENGELKLYIASMFRLLVAKDVATPDEIQSLIRMVDESDGQVDNAFRDDVVPGKSPASDADR